MGWLQIQLLLQPVVSQGRLHQQSVGGSCLSCLDYVTNLFEYKWIGNVSTDKSSALPFMPLSNFSTFGLCSFHCTQRSWLALRLSQTGINLLKFPPYCFIVSTFDNKFWSVQGEKSWKCSGMLLVKYILNVFSCGLP